MTDAVGNERAPFELPVYNARYLATTAATLRAQALHSPENELADARILRNLQQAQDDIAASIQLIQKRCKE